MFCTFQQHIKDFLILASNTIDSYTSVVNDREVTTDDKADKSRLHFVLALCGVVTNIAASSTGREFLMSHGEGMFVWL